MGYLLGYTQRDDEAKELISRLESSILIPGDEDIESHLMDLRLIQW